MSRLVILTGTLDINQLFGSTTDAEQVIASALQNQGFNVTSVRVTEQGLLRGGGGNITIEVNVDDAYTAEDARVSAILVIQSIPNSAWAIGQSNQMFTNVALKILSDGKSPTASTDATLDTMLNNLYQSAGTAIKNTTSNVGIPVAVAAVVIAFLFLNKR